MQTVKSRSSKSVSIASDRIRSAVIETLEQRQLMAFHPLLNLQPQFGYPQIDSGQSNAANMGLTYNASTQTFSVNGFPTSMQVTFDDGIGMAILNGSLTIQAHVDQSGNVTDTPSFDEFVVTGTTTPDTTNGGAVFTGDLLRGSIVTGQFGSSDSQGTDNYDMKFVVTGGALATPTGNQHYFYGQDFGVAILSTQSNFNDNGQGYNTDFSGRTQALIGALPKPSALSGFVYQDTNNNGMIDLGEQALKNVTVTLTGTSDQGNSVGLSAITDNAGFYSFQNLRPGTYTLHEDQPAGYADGKDHVGSEGDGSHPADYIYPAGTDTFANITLYSNTIGTNYNYGEGAKTTTDNLNSGDTATIGFWHNKNGQALLNKLNGGPNATNLGNWLATTFPNMYGPFTGSSNTTGLTNAQVANLYIMSRFNVTGVKLDAQVMATAFAVYVTNQSLAGGNYAASYGFDTSGTGTGATYYNVGSNGAAFGFANNTSHTIMDYLVATNMYASNGVLWDTNSSGTIDSMEQALRNMANVVFSAINQNGDIT